MFEPHEQGSPLQPAAPWIPGVSGKPLGDAEKGGRVTKPPPTHFVEREARLEGQVGVLVAPSLGSDMASLGDLGQVSPLSLSPVK